ncbi:hypothetical protein PMIN04_010741 [Paraphaeosphaeria minitans]
MLLSLDVQALLVGNAKADLRSDRKVGIVPLLLTENRRSQICEAKLGVKRKCPFSRVSIAAFHRIACASRHFHIKTELPCGVSCSRPPGLSSTPALIHRS